MPTTTVKDLARELDNATRSLNNIQTAIGAMSVGSHTGANAHTSPIREAVFENENDADLARNEIMCRRERERMFPTGIFADPAWDIILDLFEFAERGKRASVTSVCIAAAVPPTTALRWIKILEDKCLIYRESDPNDKRRYWLHLTDQTKINVRRYLSLRRQHHA